MSAVHRMGRIVTSDMRGVYAMLAVCVCFCRYASLSASAVVIHYEEALYQVYTPLPYLCLI